MRHVRSIIALTLIAAASTVWAASQSLGPLTLTVVSPRIMTPNDDQLNDKIFFKFDDTLAGIPLDTAIYDINGAKVAGMVLDATETALTWDGKDDGGSVVPSGIYVYSIKIGKNRASGTVVVAR
jgi:flagellar hook assembly protein FlgD